MGERWEKADCNLVVQMYKIITFRADINMANTVNIDFQVYAETSLGEQVYICGNVKELGNWEISKALKLTTSKEIYPEWKNEKSLYLLENVSFEFKIFIKNSGGSIRWQKIQDNRKIIPTTSILINLTYSKYEMIFQQKIIKEEFGIRKNTYELIHDLSDEMSSSSSGNEREYWLDKVNQHNYLQTNEKEFISQVKSLYDNWVNEKTKIKQKIANQWTQIITSLHFIIKKNKTSYIANEQVIHFKVGDLLDNETQKKKQQKIHEISINQLDNYMRAVNCPETTLKLFHIYQEDLSEDVLKKMKRLYQGYFIVHLSRFNTNDKFYEDVQMITTKSKQVLKDCLEYFGSKRNYGISMFKENQFLIKKANRSSIFLYFSPELPFLNDELSLSNEYLSSVEKNLLNQKNFPLLDNLKMSVLMEQEMLTKGQKEKFSLIIMCDKLVQIPAKILNLLIRVAGCQNVSVFVITNDEISEIGKKLPCSKEVKILVCNMDGVISKPEKKPINMYEELKISMKKYDDLVKEFSSKANYWIQNGEIEVVSSGYVHKFYFKDDVLGEEMSEYFLNQFHKINIKMKYVYEIEKFNHGKEIVIDIRPIIISVEFICKVITSINASSALKNYFFSFDYTDGNSKFIQKVDKSCSEKKIVHQGFAIENSNHRKGLTQQKFQQFLNQLLNISYSSVSQHLQKPNRSISKRNKEKNTSKSAYLN